MNAERLEKAYDYLYSQGIVRDKRDLAKKLNVTTYTLSRYFSDKERGENRNLCKRINQAFYGLFNYDWLMTGEGEMITNPAAVKEYRDKIFLEANKLFAERHPEDVKTELPSKVYTLKELKQELSMLQKENEILTQENEILKKQLKRSEDDIIFYKDLISNRDKKF